MDQNPIYLNFEFEVVALQNPYGDFFSGRSAMTSFIRMSFSYRFSRSQQKSPEIPFESQDSKLRLLYVRK